MALTVESLVVDIKLKTTQVKKGFEETARSAKELTDEERKLKQQTDALFKSFTGLQSKVILANNALDLMGRSISILGSAMKSTVGQAVSLERGVAQISTLLDDAASSTINFTDEVLKLQSKFGTGQQELISSFYESIASGVVDAADATAFLADAQKLAIGGVAPLKTVIDGLTTVIASYGMEISDVARISDIMFVGAREGKTSISELSQDMGRAAQVAGTMNVSFEELVSALSAITTGGIDTRTAVIQLRQLLLSLATPSDRLIDVFKELNISSVGLSIKQKGLASVLKEIVGVSGRSTTALAELFQEVNAVGAATALTSQTIGGKFVQNLKIMEEASTNVGAITQKSFEKIAQTASFQLDIIGARAEVSMTRIGQVIQVIANPAIRALASSLESVADLMTRMTEATMNLSTSWGDLAIAVGKVTAAILVLQGLAIVKMFQELALRIMTSHTALAAIEAVIARLSAGFSAVSKIILFMARQLILVAAPVIALVGAFELLFSGIKNIGNVIKLVGLEFKKIFEFIKGIANDLGLVFTGLIATFMAPFGMFTKTLEKNSDLIKKMSSNSNDAALNIQKLNKESGKIAKDTDFGIFGQIAKFLGLANDEAKKLPASTKSAAESQKAAADEAERAANSIKKQAEMQKLLNELAGETKRLLLDLVIDENDFFEVAYKRKELELEAIENKRAEIIRQNEAKDVLGAMLELDKQRELVNRKFAKTIDTARIQTMIELNRQLVDKQKESAKIGADRVDMLNMEADAERRKLEITAKDLKTRTLITPKITENIKKQGEEIDKALAKRREMLGLEIRGEIASQKITARSTGDLEERTSAIEMQYAIRMKEIQAIEDQASKLGILADIEKDLAEMRAKARGDADEKIKQEKKKEKGGFGKFIEGVASFGGWVQGFIDAIGSLLEMFPKIFNSAGKILQSFTRTFIPSLNNAMKQFRPMVREFFRELPKVFDQLGDLITDKFMQGMTENVPELSEQFVEPLIDGILNFITTFVDNIDKMIEQIGSRGPKIIMAIVVGVIKSIPKIITVLAQAILSLIQEIITGIGELLQEFERNSLAMLDQMLGRRRVDEAAKAAGGAIAEFFQGIIGSAEETFSVEDMGAGGDVMGNKFQEALKQELDKAGATWAEWFKKIGMGWHAFMDFVEGLWLSLRSVVVSFFEAIGVFGQALIDNVINPLVAFGSGILETVSGAIESLSSALGQLWMSIRGAVEGGIFEVVKSFFASIVSAAKDPLQSMQNLFGKLNEMSGGMIDKVQSMFSTVSGLNGGTLDKLITSIRELGSIRWPSKPSWLNKGGHVLKRQFGGVTPGGGVDSVPAMLTPGEYVINRNAANSLGAATLAQLNRGIVPQTGGGGLTVGNISISISGGGNVDESFVRGKLADTLVDEIKRRSLDGDFVISKKGLR